MKVEAVVEDGQRGELLAEVGRQAAEREFHARKQRTLPVVAKTLVQTLHQLPQSRRRRRHPTLGHFPSQQHQAPRVAVD